MIKIKPATPDNAQELLAIYAPYVDKTNITFEYEVPSLEEFRKRICHTIESYPYLVAVEDGTILGYTYASSFKNRDAYDWSVETSIYIREDIRGRGIGSALYKALEECLYRQHICNLCACISYPHPESIAFHEKFGYKQVAHFHKSGYKNSQWIDMIWMEKSLYPHEQHPLPFIPYPQLSKDEH